MRAGKSGFLSLLFLALISPVQSMAVSQSARLPILQCAESSEGVKVKSLGGCVRITTASGAGPMASQPGVGQSATALRPEKLSAPAVSRRLSGAIRSDGRRESSSPRKP